MQIEVWKNIKGFQGLYQVSNLGNIKSFNYNKTNKEKILIGSENKRGYKSVLLSKNGKHIRFLIHRLVYTAFVGVIPQGYHVDHKDNDQQNNRLDNLQLLTVTENLKKRFSDNLMLRYIKAKKIKCLNNNVIYNSINDASRELNLWKQSINKVLKGKRKQTGGYTFVYVDDNTEDKIEQVVQE